MQHGFCFCFSVLILFGGLEMQTEKACPNRGKPMQCLTLHPSLEVSWQLEGGHLSIPCQTHRLVCSGDQASSTYWASADGGAGRRGSRWAEGSVPNGT